jgi:G:T-mismatch repair DNA endonuclease (very short patch repair protein)
VKTLKTAPKTLTTNTPTAPKTKKTPKSNTDAFVNNLLKDQERAAKRLAARLQKIRDQVDVLQEKVAFGNITGNAIGDRLADILNSVEIAHAEADTMLMDASDALFSR